MRRGFTLIELLVVIAILGLLASTVLVSARDVRLRARIARALAFSQSTQNILGAHSVAGWSFEKIEGSQVLDSWGNNPGTVYGATLAPGVKQLGNALSFDGSDDYIVIPDSDSLDGMDAITIEFWINPNKKDKYSFISKKDCYEYKYKGKDGGYTLEFKVFNKEVGHFKAEGKGKIDIEPGVWHHLAATYDESSGVKVFLDGTQPSLDKEKVGGGGPVGDKDSPLYLGSKDGNKEYYNGFMDEVKIYEKALTAGEIGQLYAEGIVRRGLSAGAKNN